MKLLLLAGTAEARVLAARLADDPRVEVLASLAGATRSPADYAVPTRIGGFGGDLSQEKFMTDNAFNAVIDATHPFSRTIPHRSQRLCARLGLPYLRFLRPGWQPGPGDRWSFVDTAVEVADLVPAGRTVFLATGRQSLPRFAALAEGRRLIARVIDPPGAPFPYPDGDWLVARPPVSQADEERTFRELHIDVLVAKDSGGPADSKLAAARALGLPVVLLHRPAPPPGDRVETVEAALAWLERLL